MTPGKLETARQLRIRQCNLAEDFTTGRMRAASESRELTIIKSYASLSHNRVI